MLKYLSKFAMEILPSVAATIIGAYIVNHYIVAKPDAPAVAAASSAVPAKANPAKPNPSPAEVASLPEAGVRAKGISEKAIFEKSATVKPSEKPQEKIQEKSAEKSPEKSQDPAEDKPAETASIPLDTKPHSAAARDKTAIRTIPLTVQPATSVVVPSSPPPAVEAVIAPEEHRDANDLARAAIERLRGSPRAPEASHAEAPRVASAPPQSPAPQLAIPAIRPLPPPIMVSAPPAEQPGPAPVLQQSNSVARIDDPRRPTPPADIPAPQVPDLQAGPIDQPPTREHRNVAEDMLLAAKSVFHAVLPQ